MNILEIIKETAENPIEEIGFTRAQWTNIFFNLQSDRVRNAHNQADRNGMVDRFFRDIESSTNGADLKARLIRYGANLSMNDITYPAIQRALQPLTADPDIPSIGDDGEETDDSTGVSAVVGTVPQEVRALMPNAPESFNDSAVLTTFLNNIADKMFGPQADRNFREEGWRRMIINGAENDQFSRILLAWRDVKRRLRQRISQQNTTLTADQVFHEIVTWVLMADIAFRSVQRAS